METLCLWKGAEVTLASTHRTRGCALPQVNEASTSDAQLWRKSLAPARAKVLGWELSGCEAGAGRSWGAVSEGETQKRHPSEARARSSEPPVLSGEQSGGGFGGKVTYLMDQPDYGVPPKF